MEKEKLSQSDLEAVLLGQVRKTAECENVQGVTILPAIGSNSPNWKAAFVCDGPKSAPDAAFQIMRALQGRYDCKF